MSYPLGPEEAPLALGTINESPEPATWRDWFALGAAGLVVFFGTSAVALLLAIWAARIIPPLM